MTIGHTAPGPRGAWREQTGGWHRCLIRTRNRRGCPWTTGKNKNCPKSWQRKSSPF